MMPRFFFRSLMSVACSLWLATSFAARQAAAEPVGMICLDKDGNPVAGAEIHLFQYDGKAKRYVPFGPFKSDAEGKAACDKELFTSDAGNFDRWFYARIPGKLVGAARSARFPSRDEFNLEGKISLWPSTSVEGKLTVPEGFDPRKVTVRVRTLHVVTGPNILDYQSFSREPTFPGLDSSLPEVFERHPDAEGRLQFDDVPVQGNLYLVTAGGGLAEAQWRNESRQFERPIELALGRECVASGRVLTPEGQPAPGVIVSARLTTKSGAMYLSTFKATTNEKGEYVLHGLPQKTFDLSVTDPKNQWVFRPMENLLGHPSTALELDLNLETGVVVSGHVFDPEGKAVGGASLSALSGDSNDCYLGNDMTDANGRYRLRLPGGKVRLYFDSLPSGFAYPRPQIVKTLEIVTGEGDVADLDFTLERNVDEAK